MVSIISATFERGDFNALRHAKPTVISVSLRSSPPNLVFEERGNGAGMVSESLKTVEGFGFANLRERAKKLNGEIPSFNFAPKD